METLKRNLQDVICADPTRAQKSRQEPSDGGQWPGLRKRGIAGVWPNDRLEEPRCEHATPRVGLKGRCASGKASDVLYRIVVLEYRSLRSQPREEDGLFCRSQRRDYVRFSFSALAIIRRNTVPCYSCALSIESSSIWSPWGLLLLWSPDKHSPCQIAVIRW